jgi:hypothetical protein
LRGAIFESWVASEIYKSRAHRGLPPAQFHFRESRGLDVDILVETADTLTLTEVKSGATVVAEHLDPLRRLAALLARNGDTRSPTLRLVYGGDTAQARSDAEVIPWSRVAHTAW